MSELLRLNVTFDKPTERPYSDAGCEDCPMYFNYKYNRGIVKVLRVLCMGLATK